MQHQLCFSVTEKDTIDGALSAYAREWLLIAASELPGKSRSLNALSNAAGSPRQRIGRWLDALQIRSQVNDSELLNGSDYKESARARQISFNVVDGDDIDGALTAYAREWLLLAASELSSDNRSLAALSQKIGTNRQRVARWLDALNIREDFDEMRKPISGNCETRGAA